MKIEIMIYVYLFICCAMIVFNIVTALLMKRRAKRTVRVSENFRYRVGIELERVRNGLPCTAEHRAYLQRKLKRVGNMAAFDTMLGAVYPDDPQTVMTYLGELDSVFVCLSAHYSGRDRIEAAYFPYIVRKYRLLAHHLLPTVVEMLMALLDEPSLYCRENAMQALYTTGDSDCVLRALKKIDRSDLFYHGKLLSDGLLNFAGSHAELAGKLIAHFGEFSTARQVDLLNYLRFSSPDHCAFAYALLCDTAQDDEIRYACLRYLGKYRYDAAYDTLCTLAADGGEAQWQYAAIASSALAQYPGERTVALLKRNLYSRNWYVRFNAADSLERLGITYAALADVMEGHDRYASEILRYRLQRKQKPREVTTV